MQGVFRAATSQPSFSRLCNSAASLRSFSSSITAQTASRLRVFPCSPSAAREAPTPIVFTSGLLSPAEVWRESLPFFKEGPSLGYTVGLLDLPGYGLASSGFDASSPNLDPLVDDLHATLKTLHTAPVIVAPSVVAVLFQKYLESFPVAGLVAVSPLPPDASHYHAFLKRLLLPAGRLPPPPPPPPPGSSDSVSAAQIVSWLRQTAAWPEAAAKLFLGLSDDELDAADLSAFTSTLETLSSFVDDQGSAKKKCGFEAAARWLHMLSAEPVNLEPQPVPMLAIYGGQDRLLSTDEDKLATVEFHQLELGGKQQLTPAATIVDVTTGQGSLVPSCLTAVEDGSVQAVSFPLAGHCPLQFEREQNQLKMLSTVIQKWIEKRY